MLTHAEKMTLRWVTADSVRALHDAAGVDPVDPDRDGVHRRSTRRAVGEPQVEARTWEIAFSIAPSAAYWRSRTSSRVFAVVQTRCGERGKAGADHADHHDEADRQDERRAGIRCAADGCRVVTACSP